MHLILNVWREKLIDHCKTMLGQLDLDDTPVKTGGDSLDKPFGFETVDAFCNGARGNHQRFHELCRRQSIWRTGSSQREQHIHLARIQTGLPEKSLKLIFEKAGEALGAPDYPDRPIVDVGPLSAPRSLRNIYRVTHLKPHSSNRDTLHAILPERYQNMNSWFQDCFRPAVPSSGETKGEVEAEFNRPCCRSRSASQIGFGPLLCTRCVASLCLR
ncbi:hypothetical protein GGD46_005961 [Rhizobium lusitanum]|uniref:Uncharacterized protein n=1 Tax=Rhizobium lusitanum TaxID=293958 RepID=A0A7X0IZL2_9HYPH|nr:hypothetical protein [Rhizobium lusitanum]